MNSLKRKNGVSGKVKNNMEKKFKRGLLKEIREEKEQELHQEELHQKYNLSEKNIMIVEKNNIIKFLLNSCFRLMKCLATIVLLILASIGLLSLIYPEIRSPLLNVLNDLFQQLMSLLPF